MCIGRESRQAMREARGVGVAHAGARQQRRKHPALVRAAAGDAQRETEQRAHVVVVRMPGLRGLERAHCLAGAPAGKQCLGRADARESGLGPQAAERLEQPQRLGGLAIERGPQAEAGERADLGGLQLGERRAP